MDDYIAPFYRIKKYFEQNIITKFCPHMRVGSSFIYDVCLINHTMYDKH